MAKKQNVENKRNVQIVIVLILGLGLASGLILVNSRTLFESKAATNYATAFSAKNAQGQNLTRNGDTFNTNSLNVNIKLNNINLLTR